MITITIIISISSERLLLHLRDDSKVSSSAVPGGDSQNEDWGVEFISVSSSQIAYISSGGSPLAYFFDIPIGIGTPRYFKSVHHLDWIIQLERLLNHAR